MRAILVLGATLALCACGGGETQSDEANMAATDNMMMDQNMAMDPMMNADANMTMDPMMNGTTNGLDPATQNMVEQDMNTNDPDTNLANGM
jgi:hypothetical protein